LVNPLPRIGAEARIWVEGCRFLPARHRFSMGARSRRSPKPRGAKFVAPQPVILNERWPPGVKDLNRRSLPRTPPPCIPTKILKGLLITIPSHPISDLGDDVRLRRSVYPLPPPRVIPDWRRLQGGHPRSSQIGVHFSDLASIGVEVRGLTWLRAKC
jgi:hypothetical protein